MIECMDQDDKYLEQQYLAWNQPGYQPLLPFKANSCLTLKKVFWETNDNQHYFGTNF